MILRSLTPDVGLQGIPLISRFRMVYLATVVLSLHWALVLFVHSTYLGQFISNKSIGALFILGSAITIIAFLFASRALERFGNHKITLALTALEFVALISMGFSNSLSISLIFFIVHQAVVPLILFNLDVFIENLTPSKERTGSKRGIILTIMSLATALAPLGAGYLITATSLHSVYLVSAALLIPFWILIFTKFTGIADALYTHINIRESINYFWNNKNLRYVFSAHFLLQLFFTWMVIYVPLYLNTHIGMGWDDIGSVLFVGLFAYVLFEYPIGRIADLYIGEKEMMMLGFFILGITTCWISFLNTKEVIPWMVTLFLTRVGASLVEVTTESYFFKHTTGRDASVISFFRITRPLAIVVGALLGSIALFYFPFSDIFIALGLTMFMGIVFSFFLVDTK